MELNKYDKTRVVFRPNLCLYRMLLTAKRDDNHQNKKKTN